MITPLSTPEVLLFGFATSLGGFLLGNRLAIGRDRRKEFNELIDSIRFSLMAERDNPGGFKSPDKVTLLKIREYLWRWQRKGFSRVVKKYEESKGTDNRESDKGGGFFYKDKRMISHAVDDLLKFLEPR